MEQIKFKIPIWDEPFQDKFEKGLFHEATYVGDRFVLMAVRKKDNLVQERLATYSKTDKEKGKIQFFVDDDKYTVEVDSWKNPFEAAVFTNQYKHEPMDDWREEIGVDDIVWEYNYDNDDPVIPHIYKVETIYYENGKFTRPEIQLHPLDEKQFWDLLGVHKQDMIRELARGTDVYSEKELKVFEEYKQWLETAPTKYKGVKHYKIECPDLPDIKP